MYLFFGWLYLWATPHQIDLNKKWLPKENNIRNFNIDALGFSKTRNVNPPHAGNRGYQLTHASQPAKQGQISQHWLADNSYFPRGRIFISCFSDPLGIKLKF